MKRVVLRILRLLFWVLALVISIYLRFYHSFPYPKATNKIIFTVLSLGILLLTFKVIIELVVIWYKIDRKSTERKLRDNVFVGLSNLFSIFTVIAIGLSILSVLGMKPSEVFTTLSIIAAAIAIVTKDFISEILIGLFSGFSSKIEIDDYVKIGKHRGKIIDIGLQKVTMQNDDDDIVYIPNLQFYNADIINYTKRDIKIMSVDFQLNIDFVNKLEALEETIKAKLNLYVEYIEANSVELKIVEISENFIDLKLQYTLKSISREIQRELRKAILKEITYFMGRK